MPWSYTQPTIQEIPGGSQSKAAVSNGAKNQVVVIGDRLVANKAEKIRIAWPVFDPIG